MARAKKLPSGSWRALVYDHTDNAGKRHYESFTAETRKEAEYLSAEFALDKKRKSAPSLSLGTAIDQYILAKQSVLASGTIRGYRRMKELYFSPICNTPLKKLSNECIQTWIGTVAASHSPKTVRNAHGLLSSTIDMFYPEFRLKTTLPQKEKPDLYTPSDMDVQNLLNHIAGKELEIAVLLAAFGPLRRGEICAVTSNDVHGSTILVNKSMALALNGSWEIKQPKTYSSYRSIEFPDFVIEKLFNIEGRLVKATPDQITSRFRRAIKSSGVPQFRFHDLRHYAASIMHAIGVPDQYIMERGGWATDNVMKTVYRGTIDSETAKVNQKIFSHFSSMQHEMQHER